MARDEGNGVWNRSRAPHCWGFEYEFEFGYPFKLGLVPKEHEAIWRMSKQWPNVPPPEEFYAAGGHDFEKGMQHVFEAYNKERRRKEAIRRKARKRAYDLSYAVVRKKRRERRKAEVREARAKYWIERRERLGQSAAGPECDGAGYS